MKTIPFQPMTNMPVFYMASSSWSYPTFTPTFKAMEASYFQQEKVLEYPSRRDLMDNIKLVPEEFVVEEKLNYNNEVSVNEGVTEDNNTMKTSNLPPPPADENPSEAIRRGPLTFDPLPQQEKGEDTWLTAGSNHTKLMRWHYRLGHLLTLCQAQAACPKWGNPQEAGKSEATQVCWLSLWHDDQDSMARQRNQGFSQSLYPNQARGMHLL
jgi:hypothetical protein